MSASQYILVAVHMEIFTFSFPAYLTERLDIIISRSEVKYFISWVIFDLAGNICRKSVSKMADTRWLTQDGSHKIVDTRWLTQT